MKNLLLIFIALVFAGYSSFAQMNTYAPVLKAPANNAINQIPNVLIDWDAVSGGTNYKVQLDTSITFSNPIVLATNNTAIQSSELLFGAMYYWRVKAYSAADSSAWSAIWKFTVTDSVKLFSPNNGVIRQMPNILLRWTALSGVTAYDCQLDTNASFTGAPFIYSVNAPKNEVRASQLLFNTQYFWRVRASHALDTSNWSLVRSFITIDSFGLKTPVNNIAALQMPDVMLTWDLISGVKGYQVIADTSILFDSPAFVYVKADTNFIKADTLLFGEKFYWTVRAFHDYDTTVWAPPFAFNVIDKPTLTAPANNATNLLYRPTFTWQPITGIFHYEFRIDTALNFAYNDTVIIPAGSGATYSPYHDLHANTWYHWKVRAISASDTSDWSNVFKFRTGTVGLEENEIISNFNVYPNPTSGKITINIDAANASEVMLTVSDIVGKEVLKQNISVFGGSNQHMLNLSDLPEGIYLMKIISDKNSFTRRIILDK